MCLQVATVELSFALLREKVYVENSENRVSSWDYYKLFVIFRVSQAIAIGWCANLSNDKSSCLTSYGFVLPTTSAMFLGLRENLRVERLGLVS
jgi:hypothetical protein